MTGLDTLEPSLSLRSPGRPGSPTSFFPRLSLPDTVVLGLFGLLNAAYVAYIAGMFDATWYYRLYAVLVLAVAGRFAVRLCCPGVDAATITAIRRHVPMILAIVYLLGFSFLVQVAHGLGVQSFTINEVSYLVGPLVIGVAVGASVPAVQDLFVWILLARYLALFVVQFGSTFSLAALTEISWEDSASPFESSTAHDVLALEMVFLAKGRRVWAGVCTVLVLLSLKRASFILSLVLWLVVRVLDRPLNNRVRAHLILVVAALAGTGLTWVLFSPAGCLWFQARTGIDLNAATTGRVDIFRIVTEQLPDPIGLGSINARLSELVEGAFGTTWNGAFHNDTLRLALEVGWPGLAFYLCGLAAIARRSRWSVVLCGYTFFVLVSSRLITHMSFWVALYVALNVLETPTVGREHYDGGRRS